ncbi:hypothetical protein JCM16303_006811 [Sporobolomyces ruberrimus]
MASTNRTARLRTEATVAYGLTVRSLDLVFAADMWSRLRAPFSFLDFVILRRRAGTLTACGPVDKDTITRLPEEVWEEIRSSLIKEERATTEEVLFSGSLGTGDVESEPTNWRVLAAQVGWQKLSQALGGCDCHLEEDHEPWSCDNISRRWDDTRTLAIEKFLSYFGLELGGSHPMPTEDFETVENFFALITAPSRFAQGNSESTAIGIKSVFSRPPSRLPAQRTIVGISSELPPDVDDRFFRIIRLFNLEVVETPVNRIVFRPEDRATANLDSDAAPSRSSGIKDGVADEIKPGWLIWTVHEQWR